VNRSRLPDRRRSETFKFECAGLHYTATVSWYPDGRIGELFIDSNKVGSMADTNARDAAICFSLAVQHGAEPSLIGSALCRDVNGNASGPLAAALDYIEKRGLK
jgi:hypothetical protein